MFLILCRHFSTSLLGTACKQSKFTHMLEVYTEAESKAFGVYGAEKIS